MLLVDLPFWLLYVTKHFRSHCVVAFWSLHCGKLVEICLVGCEADCAAEVLISLHLIAALKKT